MTDLTIGEGTRVTLHFSLALEDGSFVDSNFEQDAVTFDVGDGNLLQGFELALFGLTAGQQSQFTILPEQGFGQHNPTNIQIIPRSQFSADLPLEQGAVFSFADAGQGELPGVIIDYDEQQVTVDFNHPLAGRVITFTVHILAVDPAVTH